MVLGGRPPGRVGRRRISQYGAPPLAQFAKMADRPAGALRRVGIGCSGVGPLRSDDGPAPRRRRRGRATASERIESGGTAGPARLGRASAPAGPAVRVRRPPWGSAAPLGWGPGPRTLATLVRRRPGSEAR